MKIIVTGAAGFIGSHLCEELLKDERNEVIGIDYKFIHAKDTWRYDNNLKLLLQHPRFKLIEQNLLDLDWHMHLPDIQIVYHLAAIPGVRTSWGSDFEKYIINNIYVTQKMLEACKEYPIQKFIYVSTSSVYGEQHGKVQEEAVLNPLSPYGISKLTGEQLCRVYANTHHIPLTILRYFTVYGPRQRPDMAFHRFIKQILLNEPIIIYGTGKQTRDFTYIDDCIRATAAVYQADHVIGETINIGGKERASVLDTIELLEEISGQKAKLVFNEQNRGEPKHTWADISKAEQLLNYMPKTNLKTGLLHEFNDLKQLYAK